MNPVRRLLLVALVVGALVAAVLAERTTDPDVGDALVLGAAEGRDGPDAAPDGALGTAWHCAAGTAATAAGLGPSSIVVANTSGEVRRGGVRWVPDAGAPVVRPLEVGPHAVVRLVAADAVAAAWVAATVELDGGGVVVEHQLRGTSGVEVAPCADAGSTEWHVAAGATTRDASEVLALYNPFADDAIVDVQVATDEGRVDPPDLVGVVIESGTLQVVDLGAHVRRQAVVAATVAARSGRLVVDRVQRFDGTEGRRGLGLSLGAPGAGLEWSFPHGVWGPATTERFHVYNPGDADAVVAIDLAVDGDLPIEPVELTVGPRAVVAFDIGADGRVPPAVGHSAVVRATNGVPIVAERELSTTSGPGQGWAAGPGARHPATRWAFVDGEASAAVDTWVVLQNPQPEAVTVAVATLTGGQEAPVPGLEAVPVPAGGRAAVRLVAHVQGPTPMVLTASAPVVAERLLSLTGAIGLAVSVGVPLAP